MPWFQHGDGHLVLVPDHMTDTVERVRKDGWQEVPAPAPASGAAELTVPVASDAAAPTQARTDGDDAADDGTDDEHGDIPLRSSSVPSSARVRGGR